MDDEDAIKAFQIAVYRQNMYSKFYKFEAIVKEVSGMDAFEAEQAGKFQFNGGNRFIDGVRNSSSNPIIPRP